MKYLFLLYTDENYFDSCSNAEQRQIVDGYVAYSQALRSADALISAAPLKHSRQAKRVHPDTVEDGPFADGKEQLGGFFLIEAGNLDEALDWAARCPAAADGHVEVRPVWNIGG